MDTQFIDVLESSTFLNCNFELVDVFAKDIINSNLSNCNITYSADTVIPAINGSLTGSTIIGLKMLSNDPLTRNS